MKEVSYIIFFIVILSFFGLALFVNDFWKNLIKKWKEDNKFKSRVLKGLLISFILIFLFVLLFIIIRSHFYQKDLDFCNNKCHLSGGKWHFSDPDVPLVKLNFENKKECIEFCSSFLRDLENEEWQEMDLKSIY